MATTTIGVTLTILFLVFSLCVNVLMLVGTFNRTPSPAQCVKIVTLFINILLISMVCCKLWGSL